LPSAECKAPPKNVRENFLIIYELEGCRRAVNYLTDYYGVARMRIVLDGRKVPKAYGENVTVTASDGYQTTFNYQQVQGQGLTTFDPNTGASVQASQPLTVIVAYYCNGTRLASDKSPLTIAIVGPQGLFTNGFWWAYFLLKIEIVPA
jgi:hypothetical protein